MIVYVCLSLKRSGLRCFFDDFVGLDDCLLFGCLLVRLFARSLVCSFACLLVRLLACLLACLPVCLSVCLDGWFPSRRVGIPQLGEAASSPVFWPLGVDSRGVNMAGLTTTWLLLTPLQKEVLFVGLVRNTPNDFPQKALESKDLLPNSSPNRLDGSHEILGPSGRNRIPKPQG